MRTLWLGLRRRSSWLRATLAVGVILFAASAAPVRTDEPKPADAPRNVLDADALAKYIDQILDASWSRDNVEPAPPADDAEFFRRAYLDLAGKIPAVSDAREFLDDRDPAKRRKLVERLLGRATFAAHFAKTWRDLMLPGASNNFQVQALVPSFEAWLRLRVANNTPYDRIVLELLTTTSRGQNQFNFNVGGEPSPVAFFQANELKPENLAAATSKIFLGVQVQCAQCHNHPMAKWTREEFWSLAAFFKGVGGAMDGQADGTYGAVQDSADHRGIEIPGVGTVVDPKFLDGTAPNWKSTDGKRATLARWVTSPDNPFFARAIANRLWAHFFGRGLVDPVDDLDESNPPSHPEILDSLARQLVYHDFDLKYLCRAITATRAYQLSSYATHKSQDEPARFARTALRSMTADQFLDSFLQATGFEEVTPGGRNAAIFGTPTAKAGFMTKFSDTGPTRTDYQPSILQALTLMNGDLIGSATSLSKSETLQAVLEAPFLTDSLRIESLFMLTLTRRPTDDETAKLLALVDNAGSREEKNSTLSDIFWALLNSAEFALNH